MNRIIYHFIGNPVIGANLGGIPEIIRDGVDGFLIASDSPKEIIEKLVLHLRNTYLRQTMAINARYGFQNEIEPKEAVFLPAQ